MFVIVLGGRINIRADGNVGQRAHLLHTPTLKQLHLFTLWLACRESAVALHSERMTLLR